MYHDKRWKQLRRRKLRESPYCAVHEAKGQAIIATDVDHIVPHKGDGSLFFDYGNLQSLCHSCHSMKTGQERRDGSLEIDE